MSNLNTHYKQYFKYLLSVTLVAAVCFSSYADASKKQIEMVRTVDNKILELKGTGRYKFMSLIKVVDGKFYLEAGAKPEEALLDNAKQLELYYHLSIKAKDFAKVTHQGIARNIPRAEYLKLAGKIDQFNKFYRDVKKGDRYTLTYIPGKGTTLALNNKELGTLEGADFASGLYSIWLGQKEPMDDDFRDDLLTKVVK